MIGNDAELNDWTVWMVNWTKSVSRPKCVPPEWVRYSYENQKGGCRYL